MILSHQQFDLEDKRLIEKVVIQAPFRLINHFQNEACFVHFSRGSTKIHSAGGSLAVHANDAILLKCGTFFSDLIEQRSGDRFEIIVFHLYPDILRRIYKTELPFIFEGPRNGSPADRIVTDDIITRFVDSLQFYFENPALVNAELLILKVRELILLLLQSKRSDTIADLFSDLFSSRDVVIRDIIDHHLFTPLSINDLAELANLSVSTLNRCFQELYGKTPAAYIKERRLDRAKQLLGTGSQTISEIALETCFNDVAHFSRSFKSMFRVTPSQYRRSIQSF